MARESARSSVVERTVIEVVERVFTGVEELRCLVLEQLASSASPVGVLTDDEVRALAPVLRRLLNRHDEVAVGLGAILEPGVVPGHPLRIEWWQWGTGHDDPVRLEVDLRPSSVGFYDYVAAEWFAVPRRTRRRHLVGPYVDVHGTDRYLLTLTLPLEVGGAFLGVVGADVPITRFETQVLGRLDPRDQVVLVNAERRVVLSTTSRWITGSLVPPRAVDGARPLDGLPWMLLETADQPAG